MPGKIRSKAFIFERLHLAYRVNNRTVDCRLPGFLPAAVNLQLAINHACGHGSVMTVDLNSEPAISPLELQAFSVTLKPQIAAGAKMMVNGFQSWTRSEEMGSADRLKPFFPPARPLLVPYGDYALFRYSGKKGCLHSWSYTYFRLPDGRFLFIGSLSEKSGYTCFEYNFKDDSLTIRKDCEGAKVESSYRLLDLYIGTGNLEQLLSVYRKLSGVTGSPAPKISGWCSWYNYYTRVSEAIIRQNLESLAKSALPIDLLQIDDGWQQAIGDWLDCNAKFPSGMKAVAAAIEQHKLKPGIWLAPLICVPSSKVYRENPHWLLRDARGRPVRAGFNPGWEGFFYALDFYAPGVQDYLDRVFRKVQEEWGYRMLKLDFLYAAALLPREGKSRGAVMTEVIDFIVDRTQKSIILGCGVPLAPVFGKFAYCRIGSDVAPYWGDYLKRLNYRERVSAENSLASTIGRSHLDRFFFRNDPDVFILRDGLKGVNRNKLTPDQRFTIFLLNHLLGGLLFCSDDLGELSGDQLTLLGSAYPLTEPELTEIRKDGDLYHFAFKIGERVYRLYANLAPAGRTITMAGDYCYHPDHFLIQPGTSIYLEPYTSKCFYQVKKTDHDYYLIGATGHLFPGAQIESILTDPEKESVELTLHSQAAPATTVYLGLPDTAGSVMVNGLNRMLLEKDRVRYARVDFPPGGGPRK